MAGRIGSELVDAHSEDYAKFLQRELIFVTYSRMAELAELLTNLSE